MTDTTHKPTDDLVKRATFALSDMQGRIDAGKLQVFQDCIDRIEELSNCVAVLEAKLAQQDDAAQVMVAAALTEAAEVVRCSEFRHDAQDTVLALIAPDAQAALDRALAAGRERIAKTAEQMSEEWADEWRTNRRGDSYLEGMMDGAEDVAAAIRKGGE